jgi:hypothetical protein
VKANVSGRSVAERMQSFLASLRIPGYVSGMTKQRPLPPSKSRPASNKALAEHRNRLRSRGLQRLEVQVRGEDAPLVRAVAAALADPGQAAEARALLLRQFAPAPIRSLKDLIASAPLDGIDLDRSRDMGRAVEL